MTGCLTIQNSVSHVLCTQLYAYKVVGGRQESERKGKVEYFIQGLRVEFFPGVWHPIERPLTMICCLLNEK